MPFVCKPVGNKYQLQKKDGSKSFGTHDTRKACQSQMRALYASEARIENSLIFDSYVSLPYDLDERINNSKDKIHVVVNTRGGSFLDAMLIHNKLRNSGKEVIGFVETYAASAGAVLLLACDKVYMPENGFLMFHMPKARFDPNKDLKAEELGQVINALQTYEEMLIVTLMAKTNKTREECKAILDKETYLTANEALELGIVTEIVPIFQDYKVENTLPEKLVQFVNEAKKEHFDMGFQEVCKEFGIEESDDALRAFIKKLQAAVPKQKAEVSPSVVNIVKDSRSILLDGLVSEGKITTAVVNDLKLTYLDEARIASDMEHKDPNGEFTQIVNAIKKNEPVMSFKGKTDVQQLHKGEEEGGKKTDTSLVDAMNEIRKETTYQEQD